MKHILKTLFLTGALTFAGFATHAQLVVWGDDFNIQPLGATSTAGAANPYGGVSWQFSGAGFGNPTVTITNDDVEGTNTQNCAFSWDMVGGSSALNFGLRINVLPAAGNTNAILANYTLNFDMALQGASLTALGGFVGPTIAVFQGGASLYNGRGSASTNPSPGFFPAAGTGYQHYSLPLAGFVAAAGDNVLVPTGPTFNFAIGFYMAGYTYTGHEEIDLQNIQILESTNPPIIPPPVVTLVKAAPALRIFAKNSLQTYNEEGFMATDVNQSWVGSTPGSPPTYSFNIKDFDTVPGFVFVEYLVPNTYFGPGASATDPYLVYDGTNSFSLTITKRATNYLASIDWKTNAYQGGNITNALLITNTLGVGTWTLKFTDDTDGTLTPPGGTPVAFTLPAAMAAQFANPCTLVYGIAPNSTAGYGQYIDIASITVTNMNGIDEFDDFTQDSYDPTQPTVIGIPGLWSPGFSVDAGSVVQVGTNTPDWVTWTLPDAGFTGGLETAPTVTTVSNNWYSPGFYNFGTPVTTSLMGTSIKWTLLSTNNLPTVDLTPGDAISPTGFFRLTTNGPSQ